MNDHENFGLVMPFIVVASAGGPYRDGDWVAGYEVGQIDALLGHALIVHRMTMPFPLLTANVPQLDLCAMRHGFVLTAEEVEDMPERSWVTFTALDAVDPTA